MQIHVTKPFIPSIEEYNKQIKAIFDREIFTNQGPNVIELEKQLREYLGVQNLHYVTNGTVALQLALSGLDINDGEIITTPFSYVATTSSIMWQRCKPVFVDIEPNNFTIDVNKIESAITDKTRAIMAVNVFGYACDFEKIEEIANKHNLKVIYDNAHGFGSVYKGKSLSSYGDVSTLSFHATKLFHTIEGGAIVCRDSKVHNVIEYQKRFGHNRDDHFMLGINAKQSEFHAAMGLCILPHMKDIIAKRKHICELYDSLLNGCVQRPATQQGLEYNYAYYPVVFKNEQELLDVFSALNAQDIFPRRYFYPSLNTLPYVEKQSCPVSEDISLRIACLPLYVDLLDSDIEKICQITKGTVK